MRLPRPLTAIVVLLATLTACVPGSAPNPTSSPRATDCAAVKNMAIAAWADHAGIVPDERSLSTWVAEHPDRSRFAPLPVDEPLDVVTLWEQREQEPDRWDDLVRYMENEGEPWLLETDLEAVVPVVDTSAADPLGWRSCG